MLDENTLEAFGTAEPSEAGFVPEKLERAIEFARANESTMNRNIGQALADGHFGEPWPIGKTIGPVKDRAEPSGVRRGRNPGRQARRLVGPQRAAEPDLGLPDHTRGIAMVGVRGE